MEKLKEMFFSERGMGIVNMLFCLSLLIRVGWLTVADLSCMGGVSRLLQETRRVKGKQDHKHRVFGVCSRPRLREPVLYVLNIQVPP